MSYLKASKDGFLIAEENQQVYIDQAMDAYTQAKKQIDALLAKTYAKLEGVAPVNYWAELSKYKRYQTLSKEITNAYNEAARLAGKSTRIGLEDSMTSVYNSQLYLTEWLYPEIKAIPIDPYLVKYTATGNVEYWNKITKSVKDKIASQAFYTPQVGTLSQLLNSNYTKELDRILMTIQNGFITGKSYTQQAREMREILGKYIKKTDTATGAMYKALRIARTEGTRVMNAGALTAAKELQSQGIKTQKMWLATLGDGRTRESHLSLDKQKRDLDKEFNSPKSSGQAPGQMGAASDNIGCRCTIITIVEDREPTVRRGVNPVTGKTDIIDFMSYPEWLKENKLT